MSPAPLCDIPSGCCSFTGLWTVPRSSLRMLRRVNAFCRPLRPVLLLVLFLRSWSPVVWCAGAVLDVAGCAVCASAAPPPPKKSGAEFSEVLKAPKKNFGLNQMAPNQRQRKVLIGQRPGRQFGPIFLRGWGGWVGGWVQGACVGPPVTYSPSVVSLRGPGQAPLCSSPHDAGSIFSPRSTKAAVLAPPFLFLHRRRVVVVKT